MEFPGPPADGSTPTGQCRRFIVDGPKPSRTLRRAPTRPLAAAVFFDDGKMIVLKADLKGGRRAQAGAGRRRRPAPMCHPPTNGTHRRTIRNGSIAVAGTQVGSTPSVSRAHTSLVAKRIVKTAAHISGTTDVSTPAGVALYATAASRLRAPKLRALQEFHVECSSHTSRCSVKFFSAHGGGRGREVCSPAS